MLSKLQLTSLIPEPEKEHGSFSPRTLSWMTWFIRVYDVGAGNDTSVHKPHHPLHQPLPHRWKLEHECFTILSRPKCTRQVFQSLARFVSRKQRYEGFEYLASKGVAI